MDDELKGVTCNERKVSWKTPTQRLRSKKQWFYYIKDRDKTEKDKRLTKHVFFLNLFIHSTESSNKQHHIMQKPVKLIQKSLKIHIFFATKFALA